MTRKRLLTWLGGVLLVAFLLAWGIGELTYPSTNPPQRYDGQILSSVSDPVLRQACFDCHSNETHHPWYRHLPLAALLIGSDISEGRENLNFSDWGQMDAERHRKLLTKALRELREGDMPPLQYRLLHPKARLDTQQIAQIAQDAETVYRVQPGQVDDHDHDSHD
ncbi:MAG TPA: heme-binding domain-containing protein [bacterium]|nr:heme-binding domain-containing protein [bacterium]